MVQTTLCTPYTVYRAVKETQTQHIDNQYREYKQFSILPPPLYTYIHTPHIYTHRGRSYRGVQHTQGLHTPPMTIFIAYILLHHETNWLFSWYSIHSFHFPFSQTFVNKEIEKENNPCQCPLPNQNKKSKKNYPPLCKKNF